MVLQRLSDHMCVNGTHTPCHPRPTPCSREVLEAGEGGGRAGTQQFVSQKWPNKIFHFVNVVFPNAGHFAVYSHCNTSLPRRQQGAAPGN